MIFVKFLLNISNGSHSLTIRYYLGFYITERILDEIAQGWFNTKTMMAFAITGVCWPGMVGQLCHVQRPDGLLHLQRDQLFPTRNPWAGGVAQQLPQGESGALCNWKWWGVLTEDAFHIGGNDDLHCHRLKKEGNSLPPKEQGLDLPQRLEGSERGEQRWPDSPSIALYYIYIYYITIFILFGRPTRTHL